MENKSFIVFSLRLANELVKRGFKVQKTGINIKYPKYTVYYFEDTEKLREQVDKINKKYQRIKNSAPQGK